MKRKRCSHNSSSLQTHQTHFKIQKESTNTQKYKGVTTTKRSDLTLPISKVRTEQLQPTSIVSVESLPLSQVASFAHRRQKSFTRKHCSRSLRQTMRAQFSSNNTGSSCLADGNASVAPLQFAFSSATNKHVATCHTLQTS